MSEVEVNHSERKPSHNSKKPALGRGLGSLLGGQEGSFAKNTEGLKEITKPASPAQSSIPAGLRIWMLPVEQLKGNENQPRKHFEKEALQELASSIRQKGILQPIVVRKLAENRYEIIAGERRWRAAQLAGQHEVPVIIKDLPDQAALEMALIENIQREDLNPIEESEAYSYLM
ncbi:MAG: ParB/RepB/Spo0J family partition protein, partial [Bdellovibrionales bacterium]|nr:ParB/RepB/Spo0J family partition protein [Bdellovibrionales bacterium]